MTTKTPDLEIVHGPDRNCLFEALRHAHGGSSIKVARFMTKYPDGTFITHELSVTSVTYDDLSGNNFSFKAIARDGKHYGGRLNTAKQRGTMCLL